jgi:hypothetical protein
MDLRCPSTEKILRHIIARSLPKPVADRVCPQGQAARGDAILQRVEAVDLKEAEKVILRSVQAV